MFILRVQQLFNLTFELSFSDAGGKFMDLMKDALRPLFENVNGFQGINIDNVMGVAPSNKRRKRSNQ